MAAGDHRLLINIDPSNNQSQFDFQDFSKSNIAQMPPPDPKSVLDDGESRPKSNFFSLDYLKTYFDVDTDVVVSRIQASMYPQRGINYMQVYINAKPDLYGPFWICVTLIFTIAISGNMANYLQAVARHESYHWKYDFHAVSVTATTIFLYAWFVPIILWLLLKYQKYTTQDPFSLMELICVYGYSLSVYIPISILWIIQVSAIQWLFLIVGASLSGYVLMTSISSAFGEKNYLVALLFLFLHVFLAVGFMLYFFHASPAPVTTITASTNAPTNGTVS